jgi:hypothetical protein
VKHHLAPQARAQRSEARIKKRSSALLVHALHGPSQVAVDSFLIAFTLLFDSGENVSVNPARQDFLFGL